MTSTNESQTTVAVIAEQHVELRRLMDSVAAGTAEESSQSFDRLVQLMAVHETAEEMVVYPAIRKMGEQKAIIFSTHILEEVEAVCSRAIIIDRGTVVANGTPQELKLRSSQAGAVTVRLTDGSAAAVKGKLDGLNAVERSVVVSESPLVVRAFPRKQIASEDLARAVGEVALKERWSLLELHTEEGRLDEVFRNITLPDTKASQAKEESK